MVTKLDARQSEYVGTLGQVSPSVNPLLDAVSLSFNDSIGKFYEDRNIILAGGGVLSYVAGSPSVLSMTAPMKLYINSRVAGGSPIVIDLGSASRNFSADGRMLYAVIDRIAGTAVVTADSATLPAVDSTTHEVFLIAKRVDLSTERLFLRNGQSFGNGDSAAIGTAAVTPIFSDAAFQIFDNVDPTKIAMFEASGITPGATRVYTLPNATTSLAGLSTAQTFTADQTFAGVIKIADGSVGAPSIALISDPTTGIFSNSPFRISFSANGVLAGEVMALGYRNMDGTETSPSYSFRFSTQSGWYYDSGTGSINASYGGVKKLSIALNDTIFTSNTVTIDKGNLPGATLTLKTSFAQPVQLNFQRTTFTPVTWSNYIPTGSMDLRWSDGVTDKMILVGNAGIGSTHTQLQVGGRVGESAGSLISSPNYSFTDSPTTGMYSDPAVASPFDTISFALRGVKSVAIQRTTLTIWSDQSGGSNPTLGFQREAPASTPTHWQNSIANSTTSLLWTNNDVPGITQMTLTTAGQLLLSDGSVSSPPFSFNNDTNTGMYWEGANQIGFATNGIRRVAINNNGTYFSSGTAAVPSLSFLSDSNTGIYSSGADEIGFATNGIQRANFNDSGIRLISGSAATPSYSFLSFTSSGMYMSTSTTLGFSTIGVRRVEIGATGIQWYEGAAGQGAWRVATFFGSSTTGVHTLTLPAGGTQILGAFGTTGAGGNVIIKDDSSLGAPYFVNSVSANSVIIQVGAVSTSYRVVVFYI